MALRSRFGKRLSVAALSVAVLVAGLVATPAAATHAGEWVLKPAFRQWTTDNGATWVNQEPAGFDTNTEEYSSDRGVTWTATVSEYTNGDATTDGNDGPAAGQFRRRHPHWWRDFVEGYPRWSTDAGGTWTDRVDSLERPVSEPAGFSFSTLEHSSDSGATWTATQPQYLNGEAGTDNNDGPDTGQFRERRPHQRQRTWVCSGVESVFTDIGGALIASEITEPCLAQHDQPTRTFTTNVDDGIVPSGDWCVVGASAIICRGEGYTYREARRQLGF